MGLRVDKTVFPVVAALVVFAVVASGCGSETVDQALAAAEEALAAAEDDLAAAEEALAAAEQGNADLEEDLIEAQQHAADTDQTLAAAEAALEVTAAELVAAEEAALRTSRDLERATSDQDDADLANQLLEEERWELRDALNEAVELANSLDGTVYPDCNPVHAEDRSLFGIPTGTDMAEVISQVTERCGPADPFIPMFDSWD